jgi:hypothetical protein
MRMWGQIVDWLLVGVVLSLPTMLHGQDLSGVGLQSGTARELDRVIAVVNGQIILGSDLDLEMRVFKLLPIGDAVDETTPKALERLTTRALIEQQIVQEDPEGLEIAPKELEDSLAELRQNLPACKRLDCTSAAGWSAYLRTLGLTPSRVDEYWTHRMAVLRFIERRFRSGIRISPEEIETYYREKLIPLYAKAADVPSLEKVTPRIQEILLQALAVPDAQTDAVPDAAHAAGPGGGR